MKLGIIGTGKIIKEALYAMTPVKEIQKNAIFARPHSKEKAERFAQEFGIPEVYTDYTALLEQADIDTVYIGLVNSVHYEYAREALLHGRNVILEKPFVLSLSQAQELAQIAGERGLFLLEAITVLHNPVFDKMRENLPRLGTVKLVLCNYSQYSSRYDDYLRKEVSPAFDPAQQGGAMRDLDVYNIHYCVGLFGEPAGTCYFPNRGFNGIDTSGALVLTYPGFTCVCTAAKDSDSPCYVTVQGEKGWMKIDGKPNAATNLTTVWVQENAAAAPQQNPAGSAAGLGSAEQKKDTSGLASVEPQKDASGAVEPKKDASGAIVRSTKQEEYHAPETHHRMTQEFQDFARIIDGRDFETAARLLQETVNVVKVLEQAAAR